MATVYLGPVAIDLLELAKQGIRTLDAQLKLRRRLWIEFEARGHQHNGWWMNVPLLYRPTVVREQGFKVLPDLPVTMRLVDAGTLGTSELKVDVVESSDGSTGTKPFGAHEISKRAVWVVSFK